jgi:hypothetical protein
MLMLMLVLLLVRGLLLMLKFALFEVVCSCSFFGYMRHMRLFSYFCLCRHVEPHADNHCLMSLALDLFRGGQPSASGLGDIAPA